VALQPTILPDDALRKVYQDTGPSASAIRRITVLAFMNQAAGFVSSRGTCVAGRGDDGRDVRRSESRGDRVWIPLMGSMLNWDITGSRRWARSTCSLGLGAKKSSGDAIGASDV